MQSRSSACRAFRSFQEARNFLERALNYEKRVSVKYSLRNFNLGRMEALLADLGDPHRELRAIHIAGTKGKGTTAALLASCLQQSGLRVGLHTSPHLVSVCERMRVDGVPATEGQFCELLAQVRPYVEQLRRDSRDDAPTYFEITTGLAFEHFCRSAVDWAVVEVGLGGRLDSTNVLLPACCIVTPIGLDHTDKLGDTVDRIAAEKAGIFKRGVPAVLGPQPYPAALEVLRQKAQAAGCTRWEVGRDIQLVRAEPLRAPAQRPEAEVGWRFAVRTPLRDHEGLRTDLLGLHQLYNAATAIGCIDLLAQKGVLRSADEAIRRGIAGCRWPARVELLARQPAFVLDAAHTVESMRALVEALQTHFPGRPLRFVFGCSRDKNFPGMLSVIAERSTDLITTRCSTSKRAADPETLAATAGGIAFERVKSIPDPVEAVRQALAGAEGGDVVCVTGSFFVAGEVRQAWEEGALG